MCFRVLWIEIGGDWAPRAPTVRRIEGPWGVDS